MSMFVAILAAKEGTSTMREATKQAHDEYWVAYDAVLRFAGPMLSDDGETRLGQIILLAVDSREAAERIVLNDPFYQVGLFSSCDIRRYRLSVDNSSKMA